MTCYQYAPSKGQQGEVPLDIVDKATRSRMMAKVGARHTAPEVTLRKALHRRGFRFRLHVRTLPGRPDIVLPRWNVAIQVHGCFWHRHERCQFTTTPATRREFWQAKFAANTRRDELALAALRRAGWRTAVIWECGLRPRANEPLVNELECWIRESQGELIELPDMPATYQS